MKPAQSGDGPAREAFAAIVNDIKAVGRLAKAVVAKFKPPEPPEVVTFLSGSLRDIDIPLLEAVGRFLYRRGFQCYTVGLNTSSAEPVEVAVRRLVDASDCLVGVATARFDAIDGQGLGETLRLAAAWVNQEPAMAYQARLPHLIFRAPDVTLQGVSESHLHIPMKGLSPQGAVVFAAPEAVVESAVRDLRAKALARRAARSRHTAVNALKTLSALAVGGYITIKTVEQLGRPSCFTTFDGYDPDCRVCLVRKDCRAEKIRRG